MRVLDMEEMKKSPNVIQVAALPGK